MIRVVVIAAALVGVGAAAGLELPDSAGSVEAPGDSAAVRRLTPRRLVVLPHGGDLLADAGGGAIWILAGRQVRRFDARTKRYTVSRQLPGQVSEAESGGDGAVWADPGIATVTRTGTGGGQFSHTFGGGFPRVFDIAVGADGVAWVVVYTRRGDDANFQTIYRITPAGAVTEVVSQSGDSSAWFDQIAVGPDGALWGTAYASVGDTPPEIVLIRVTASGQISYPYREPAGSLFWEDLAGTPDGALLIRERRSLDLEGDLTRERLIRFVPGSGLTRPYREFDTIYDWTVDGAARPWVATGNGRENPRFNEEGWALYRLDGRRRLTRAVPKEKFDFASPDEIRLATVAGQATFIVPTKLSTSRAALYRLPAAAARLPALGKTVVAKVVRGVVRFRRPGSRRFERLGGSRLIPVGSLVDTRRGRVRLTSATNSAGATQTAVFYGGLFRLSQSRATRAAGRLGLRLMGKLACARPRASRRLRGSRHVWGRGTGRYRTRGRRSAASVTGTTWLVEDRCDGSTLTRVRSGTVKVRDFRRHRTVTLRAGQSYVAR